MYHIETTIALTGESFTLCEKGDIQMNVWVVTTVMDGIVMGVYSKPRKAEARRVACERDNIAVTVTEATINTEYTDEAQDET